MKAELETTIRAVCPSCAEPAWTIQHEPGRYGPWGCENCGARYLIEIGSEGIELERQEGDDVPAWLIVKLVGMEPPTYFVIDFAIYHRQLEETPSEDERAAHSRYWVEEHTCPTNLIPVAAIVSENNDDPHGILEFVAHVPKRDPHEEEPEEGWAAFVESVACLTLDASQARPPSQAKVSWSLVTASPSSIKISGSKVLFPNEPTA